MTRPRKLALLGALYLVQGLPFGFQATALPVYLRQQGVSLTAIGWASALSLPWLLKVLWAPLVDRFGSRRLGRRKSWILPAQGALAAACVAASFVPPESELSMLLALVFLMNLAAATQDIAVDGLAVDLLGPDELGPGNAAQVIGYKVGMLTGGGLLVWAADTIGWQGLFLSMAGVVVAVMAVAAAFSEPAPTDAAAGPRGTPGTVRDVLAALRRALRSRRAVTLLVVIATYKTGEALIDQMWKPFLVDGGFTAGQIGLWVGTWGMACSLAGSLAGGVLAARTSIPRALVALATLRLVPELGQLWLAGVSPGAAEVIVITCAEHFAGGALTVVVFALMMSRVNRTIGATHYTLLAAVEVLGKGPSSWLSGQVADAAGYPTTFGLGVVGSLAWLALVIWYAGYERRCDDALSAAAAGSR